MHALNSCGVIFLEGSWTGGHITRRCTGQLFRCAPKLPVSFIVSPIQLERYGKNMKYYKKNIPSKWQVFAFEPDGSQDSHIDEDMIAITEDEAKTIASSLPVDSLALDVIRNASTKRNWGWPPKSYQEAIGQIAVSSSSIEVLIRTVIWHISGLDSITGRAFTGKMRISELSEVLKALIECKAPQLKKDAAEICTRV